MKNTPFIIFFGIIGIFSAAISIPLIRNTVIMGERVAISAQVLRVGSSSHLSSSPDMGTLGIKTAYGDLNFRLEEQNYSLRNIPLPSGTTEGTRITIYIDPEDPEQIVMNREKPNLILIIPLSLLSLGFLGATVFLTVDGIRSL
ncbi:MAG: hypothetical protein JEY99_10040 [Spirochaetales bacterium]|nr:hypothetical protein [Spirochaetales bacterium]